MGQTLPPISRGHGKGPLSRKEEGRPLRQKPGGCPPESGPEKTAPTSEKDQRCRGGQGHPYPGAPIQGGTNFVPFLLRAPLTRPDDGGSYAQRLHDGIQTTFDPAFEDSILRGEHQGHQCRFPILQGKAAELGFSRQETADKVRHPVIRYPNTAMRRSLPQKVHDDITPGKRKIPLVTKKRPGAKIKKGQKLRRTSPCTTHLGISPYAS